MDEKAKELRRAYKRNWYRKNKEKQKAANERYWNKKAAEAASAAEQAEAAANEIDSEPAPVN